MSGTLHIIHVDGSESVVPYSGKRPKYEQLRDAVGGLIETVKVRYAGRVREAYANEEGLIHGLEYNGRASAMSAEFGYNGIVGPIVVIVPTAKERV